MSCAVDDKAFLSAASYGDFVVHVDQRLLSAPIRDPSSAAFVTGRLIGKLNAISLKPPYRAEEDAFARSLHYPIGKFPQVPLVGQVVLDNHGLLEVYEEHFVYRSPADADAWLSNRSGAVLNPSDFVTSVVDANHVSVRSFRPAAYGYETSVSVGYSVAGVYVLLSFQGGTGVTPAAVAPLVRESENRLASICGLVA